MKQKEIRQRNDKKWNNRQIGTRYEQAAGAYLESLGYRVVEYNYRCRLGEIDIIARDGEYLVFCEVKYRTDESKGMPAEAVDVRKQRIISKCALYYITSHGLSYLPCRFDVIGILGREDAGRKSVPTIQLYKDAFDYMG